MLLLPYINKLWADLITESKIWNILINNWNDAIGVDCQLVMDQIWMNCGELGE